MIYLGSVCVHSLSELLAEERLPKVEEELGG